MGDRVVLRVMVRCLSDAVTSRIPNALKNVYRKINENA